MAKSILDVHNQSSSRSSALRERCLFFYSIQPRCAAIDERRSEQRSFGRTSVMHTEGGASMGKRKVITAWCLRIMWED
ncbi:hypothetical protein KP509_11G022600 [Ceratopteris richardii]|uniref:Uncharacterized protein n=1 Tax=Ceratopteris richardii TaxID=49495 RepID=A0A8T2TMQ8_CERRI|nr:hypothetical protein KP509_11G022600 [Ceratopteris richardii]